MILGTVKLEKWERGLLLERQEISNNLTSEGALTFLRNAVGGWTLNKDAVRPHLMNNTPTPTTAITHTAASHPGWTELSNYTGRDTFVWTLVDDDPESPTIFYTATKGTVAWGPALGEQFSSSGVIGGVALGDPAGFGSNAYLLAEVILDSPCAVNANTTLTIEWTFQIFNPANFPSPDPTALVLPNHTLTVP
jgi:hypothetical protein